MTLRVSGHEVEAVTVFVYSGASPFVWYGRAMSH